MNKRIFLCLFIIPFLFICFTCEKDLVITELEIHLNSNYPVVGENLVLSVVEYAEIGGIIETAEDYDWSIKDSHGRLIKEDLSNTRVINWTPEKEGNYEIAVKIGYGGFRSTKAIMVIYGNEPDCRFLYSGDYHFTRTLYIWTEQSGATCKLFKVSIFRSCNSIKLKCDLIISVELYLSQMKNPDNWIIIFIGLFSYFDN